MRESGASAPAASPPAGTASATRSGRSFPRLAKLVMTRSARRRFADGHARVERGVRILEDDLHSRRSGRMAVLPSWSDVAAAEHDRPRGRLDQPQHDRGPWSTCRNRIRRPDPGFRLGNGETDAIDGVDIARCAARSLLQRKCFFRSGPRAALALLACLRLRLDHPCLGELAASRRPMARPFLHVGRIGSAAARVEDHGAARRELAARGQVEQCRHHAGDRPCEPATAASAASKRRDRCQQALRVRVQRQCRTVADHRPPRPCARHTSRRRAAAVSATTPEIVGDQHHAPCPSSRLS